MNSFIAALMTNPLLQAAILAGFAASVAGGIIGSYVVVKRIVFISGSIAHCVLSGMGLALFLRRTQGIMWLTPLLGALVAAIISALIIGWIHLNYREREDSIIATLWSIGMAIGIVFISQTPGYNVELMSFLLGNILWVSTTDLILLSVLDGIILITVLLLHKRFLALCFDEKQALLQGIPVNGLYLLLLSLIAVSVVLLIQVVGIILVLTMLTIPASIASNFTNRLAVMMVIAVILNVIFSFVGTAGAYFLDWPVSATIALLSGAAYLITLNLKRVIKTQPA
jgi:zinc transport system permease protein